MQIDKLQLKKHLPFNIINIAPTLYIVFRDLVVFTIILLICKRNN